jgi:serine/threonine protein kinase
MGLEEKYDLLEVLGSGTYAKVHRCVHRASGDELAMKVIQLKQLRKLYAQDFSVLAVEQEVNVLAKLHHPCLVELREAFTSPDQNTVYIVMELAKVCIYVCVCVCSPF